MLINIKDNKTGVIYSSDMSEKNKHSILEINFCTSYIQVTVQDEIVINNKKKYPTHDIILSPTGSESNWVDLIATQSDNCGTWV